MKLFRAYGGALAVASAILSAPAMLGAQTITCNLTSPTVCDGTVTCKQGCAAPISVFHATSSPCGATPAMGSFDLTKTQYANTCFSGNLGCTVSAPPIRFWQYDAYSKANSGCADPVTGAYLANGFLDFTIGSTAGYWFLYQANWQNPQGDGCIAAGNGELRTVAEISFPDAPNEGTVNHRSWYLIAAINNANDYDFDGITGATTACAGSSATVDAQTVGGVSIAGKTSPCTGATTVTSGSDNAADATYFNVSVTLDTPSPDYYTEQGKSPAGKRLIAGYQILYAGGTTTDATSEPKSSSATGGSWRPVRDVTDPTKAAVFVPYGTTGSTTVAIPKGTCTGTPVVCPWYWLATRLVYQDASQNPANVFDPSTTGPLVVSDVSGHCGPVAGGTSIAVQWGKVDAVRLGGGIEVTWQTLDEDDSLRFEVVRVKVDSHGTESAPEAVPGSIEARGDYSSYNKLDESVALDVASTYKYYVQEYTSAGPGSRSPVMTVPGVTPGVTQGGGRSRSRGRR